MGLLIDGRWHDQWYDTSASGGRFVRPDSVFRNWVTTDGTPGPTGGGGYRAEAGRYHLYVSLACPWAHRTLIFRAPKGLTPLIDVSVLHWLMAEQGWSFAAGDGVVPDPIGGAHYLHEVYERPETWVNGRFAPKGGVAPATSELSAQGSGAPSAVDHLVHERSKSNDEFGCSLTVAGDPIERQPDSFQIRRFSAQPG
jgi:hypothetical protein